MIVFLRSFPETVSCGAGHYMAVGTLSSTVGCQGIEASCVLGLLVLSRTSQFLQGLHLSDPTSYHARWMKLNAAGALKSRPAEVVLIQEKGVSKLSKVCSKTLSRDNVHKVSSWGSESNGCIEREDLYPFGYCSDSGLRPYVVLKDNNKRKRLKALASSWSPVRYGWRMSDKIASSQPWVLSNTIFSV
ncbi:conserved hypothetical protein [Ricinus communis]|uniref:Uncharacterized protein n=1 Tax=Ricinus communis TaxID=3988 RepID=B9S794_RICCO|nr:conserved hypothetical protein [Ricinus communis]